uniref:Uncharacterized protein n=1 Tax=Odontella aurita TaxID=265563 RepID=A0A7S4MPH2_9STRA
MACSLGRLMRVSPSASDVAPDLDARLLPALRDPSALVLALYLRTGRTDDMVMLESGHALNRGKRRGRVRRPQEVGIEVDPGKVRGEGELTSLQTRQIECAAILERERLLEARRRGQPFERVVWMLVTDSPWVRGEVVRLRNGAMAADNVVQREVLTTPSRGVHTLKRRGPSDLDFAEAAVDWYLMGETDLVIGGGMYSFCKTAALRTFRPYFDGHQGCFQQDLV